MGMRNVVYCKGDNKHTLYVNKTPRFMVKPGSTLQQFSSEG